MKIKFPRGIEVDINDVPEDFDEQIRNAFEDYTEGTSESYTYQDKLLFIDRCRELLHHSEDEEDCVMDLMHEYFDYSIKECGEIPDKETFLNVEFIADCYKHGKTNLYAHYTGDHHKDDKIMKLLERVIKVVINYEPERVDE